MLQLDNRTAGKASIAVLPNQRAIDCLFVVLRATFELMPRLALSSAQRPPVVTDEYHGEPGASSLAYASELHLGKAGTDVILLGHAHTTAGPVTETAVVVSAAERKKIVRVTGDRFWLPGGYSRPLPFTSMPLLYERAFGGSHEVAPGEPALAEERNPVGVGFRGRRSADEMEGLPLPNLEDPARPMRGLGDRPPPACFGFVAPSWLPRRYYAGTYDDAWQRTRAPYVPLDFDLRFFNAASPELTFERFLEGGEPIEVLGASPSGPVRFALPRATLRATVLIARRRETPLLRLDTVIVEPDANRVSLSYRAALECDKQALDFQRVTLEGGWELAEGAA